MSPIFHIVDSAAWQRAQAAGVYEGDTLQSEGFIHFSTRDQVVRVANARFHGRRGLVLLTVDPARVGARIVHENLEGGAELFPHVYGALPINAVISVAPFEPGDDGNFAM